MHSHVGPVSLRNLPRRDDALPNLVCWVCLKGLWTVIALASLNCLLNGLSVSMASYVLYDFYSVRRKSKWGQIKWVMEISCPLWFSCKWFYIDLLSCMGILYTAYLYTSSRKFWILDYLFFFFKEVSNANKGCIYLIKTLNYGFLF